VPGCRKNKKPVTFLLLLLPAKATGVNELTLKSAWREMNQIGNKFSFFSHESNFFLSFFDWLCLYRWVDRLFCKSPANLVIYKKKEKEKPRALLLTCSQAKIEFSRA
jgi:hypothetical protein